MNIKKLRAKMVENGYTLKTLSKAMGLSISTIQRKVSGTCEFSRDEIEKLSKVLKLNSEQIIDIFFTLKVS